MYYITRWFVVTIVEGRKERFDPVMMKFVFSAILLFGIIFSLYFAAFYIVLNALCLILLYFIWRKDVKKFFNEPRV